MRKHNAVSCGHPREFFERSMVLHEDIMSELHTVLLMHMVHSLHPAVDNLLKGQIPLFGHQ